MEKLWTAIWNKLINDATLVSMTGYTTSTGFPTVYANDSTHNGNDDCFITKLSDDGRSLVYSTFLGGSNRDRGYRIAVEGGYVYITGYTQSTDFFTVNAMNSTFNG